MESLMEICGLAVGYVAGKKTNVVLNDINLSLKQGELTCLLGANGVGKSTLLRTLTGAQSPLNGEIRVFGKPLRDYNQKQLSRLIGVVTTERTYAGGLTVTELVGLGRQPYTGFWGRMSETDKRVVEKAMTLVGIAHKRQNYIAELSDGERQKAMIARALAQETPFIVLDEPTSFLDVASRIEIFRLLHDLAKNEGKAILLSTHDVSQSLAMSDRLCLLTKQSIHVGVPEDLVLSGCMNDLFPSESLDFDMSAGEYYIKAASGLPIAVSAATPVLERWLGNALSRNGYVVTPAAERVVKAESPNEIRIAGIDRVFVSIEELLSAMEAGKAIN